jgi:hypothetical protein
MLHSVDLILSDIACPACHWARISLVGEQNGAGLQLLRPDSQSEGCPFPGAVLLLDTAPSKSQWGTGRINRTHPLRATVENHRIHRPSYAAIAMGRAGPNVTGRVPGVDDPAQRLPVAVGSLGYSGLPDKVEPLIDTDMALIAGQGCRGLRQRG